MSPHSGVATTRRTALTGAVCGALALAGCDGDEAATAPSPTAATTSAAPDDPDDALVAEVVAELDELIAFTAAAAASRSRIGEWPAAFEALHRAHREVLTDDDLDDAQPPDVSGSAKQVERRVTQREREAQGRLAEWAVTAQSGQLARLLASMSAAIGQQLASPVGAAG